jgi:hypothetical protein
MSGIYKRSESLRIACLIGVRQRYNARFSKPSVNRKLVRHVVAKEIR